MAPGGGCRIQWDRPVMSGGGYETQRGKAFAQSDSDFPWLYRALNRDLPSALPLRPVRSCPLFSLLSVQGCPHESGHHAVCSLLDGDPSTARCPPTSPHSSSLWWQERGTLGKVLVGHFGPAPALARVHSLPDTWGRGPLRSGPLGALLFAPSRPGALATGPQPASGVATPSQV